MGPKHPSHATHRKSDAQRQIAEVAIDLVDSSAKRCGPRKPDTNEVLRDGDRLVEVLDCDRGQFAPCQHHVLRSRARVRHSPSPMKRTEQRQETRDDDRDREDVGAINDVAAPMMLEPCEFQRTVLRCVSSAH